MSKAQELMRQALEDPAGEMLRPVRKTVLQPQADGSVLRHVLDKNGAVIAEDIISAEQRLALDARIRLGLSQHQFADLLGISVRTLHDWEQGRREPSGAAKTLLKVVALHPQVVQEVMGASVQVKAMPRVRRMPSGLSQNPPFTSVSSSSSPARMK